MPTPCFTDGIRFLCGNAVFGHAETKHSHSSQKFLSIHNFPLAYQHALTKLKMGSSVCFRGQWLPPSILLCTPLLFS